MYYYGRHKRLIVDITHDDIKIKISTEMESLKKKKKKKLFLDLARN